MPISAPSARRQPYRKTPPGRRSISQTVMAHSAGPSQWGRCSGLVHMANTSGRGAAKARVMTTSSSEATVNSVTPNLPTIAGLLTCLIILARLELDQVGVQPVAADLPEAAEARRPLGDLADRR